MGRSTFSQRLNSVIRDNNIRQVDLCKKTGIGKSAMSQYLSGAFAPKQQNLHALATALDVSEAWLMGYDVPRERPSAGRVSGSDAETFYFTAPDDSMENAHIPKGSRVLIQESNAPGQGQIVCFSANGAPLRLRRFHRKNGLILLSAASSNPDSLDPLIFSGEDLADGSLDIRGVAVEIVIKL